MRARVLYGLPETYPGRREYKLLLSRYGIPSGRGRKIMNDGFARVPARFAAKYFQEVEARMIRQREKERESGRGAASTALCVPGSY